MRDCSYRFALGHPNQGFHTHVGGVAVGDVVATLIISWLVVRATHANFSLVAGLAFLLAFALHKVFCVHA